MSKIYTNKNKKMEIISNKDNFLIFIYENNNKRKKHE